MIGDRPRTDAFARAIGEVVRPGNVVLDVGTGTGILAMLAARAGARKVYAIDQSDIARVAEDLVRANGMSDRIEVIQTGAADVRLPERADVIVSEWLGHMAFVEGMLADVLAARDANLILGGRMIPSAVRLLLSPIDDPILYGREGPGFWRDPISGLDFRSLEAGELAQGRACQVEVQPAALLAGLEPLVEVDLARCGHLEPWKQGARTFAVRRNGVLNGFVACFAADLSPSVVLDTSPGAPGTHWAQTYLPFDPRFVREGDVLDVRFALAPDPDERRFLSLELEAFGRTRRYSIQ